jgi:TonB family protein
VKQGLLKLLLSAMIIWPGILSSDLKAEGGTAYLNTRGVNNPEFSAVDANGVRHNATDYPQGRLPWLNDPISTRAPDYPFEDTRLRHEGTGVFRLKLDLATGAVRNVTLIRSTGFGTLDDSALSAFYRWRWKPGKWKEITMGVTFKLSTTEPLLPGAKRLRGW